MQLRTIRHIFPTTKLFLFLRIFLPDFYSVDHTFHKTNPSLVSHVIGVGYAAGFGVTTALKVAQRPPPSFKKVPYQVYRLGINKMMDGYYPLDEVAVTSFNSHVVFFSSVIFILVVVALMTAF